MAAKDSVSLGIKALCHELQAIYDLVVIVIYRESFARESSYTGPSCRSSATGGGLGIHSESYLLQEVLQAQEYTLMFHLFDLIR